MTSLTGDVNKCEDEGTISEGGRGVAHPLHPPRRSVLDVTFRECSMFLWKSHAFPKTHFGFVPDEFPEVENFIKLLSSRQIYG